MTQSLSDRLVELARDLQAETHVDDTAEVITRALVDWIGQDVSAGVSMVHRHRRIDTLAPTSEVAKRGDALQYQLGEGPCIDAVWDHHQVHAEDLSTDERWPTWAPTVAKDLDVHSMLCTRLFTRQDTLGALNIYSPHRFAFDEEVREDIMAMAAHAAVAVAAVLQIEGLTLAVDRRTTIGTGLGIVMERFDLDQARAFDVLRRLSSQGNRKLYDVAKEITTTRAVPTGDDR